MLFWALISLAHLALMGVVHGTLEGISSSVVRFVIPPRQPRIYARAPSGVGVTKVRAIYERAIQDTQTGECDPRYYLSPLNEIDPPFKLDECQGILQTAKPVERDIGEIYSLEIIAKNPQNVTLGSLDLQIKVTIYNKHSPFLNDSYNSLELFEKTPVGSVVMRLHANDLDQETYNRELFYFLQDPTLKGKDPWLYPTTSPLSIEASTGEIRISEDLTGMHSPLFFKVGVGDGGSPHRLQTVKMVLDIRKMSAPVNASIREMRQAMAVLCWSPPKNGEPLGYLISYRNSYRPRKINLTLNDLLTSTVSRSPEEKTKTHCYELHSLQPYTHYIIDIKAWNKGGLSMSLETPLTIFTRGQVCTDSICGNGICQESSRDPGYTCICAKGYYGFNCQLSTPCIDQDGGQTLCNNQCLHNGGNLCLCTSAISEGECPLSSRCFSKPSCFTSDHCASSPGKDFYCYCNFKFEGKYCPDENKKGIINSVRCKETVTSHIEGNLSWPETLEGGTIVLPCPYVSKREIRSTPAVDYNYFLPVLDEVTIPHMPLRTSRSTKNMFQEPSNDILITSKSATRKCLENGQWGSPDLRGCRRLWEYEPKNPMSKGFDIGIVEGKSVDQDITDAPMENSKADVEQNLINLVRFAQSSQSGTESAAQMGKTLDKLLNSNISAIDEDRSRTTELIRESLDQFSDKVSLNPGEKVGFKTPDVILETRLLMKENIDNEVSFRPSFDDENLILGVTRESQFKDNLHLTIPKEVLEAIADEGIRVQFMSFKDDRLFQGRRGQKAINMPVISASIRNHKIKGLKTPIRFEIPLVDPPLAKGVQPKCVFWNEEESEWSEDGLQFASLKDDIVSCLSTHLTAFSVLLDPIAEPVDSTHQTAFTFITYAGLSLSTAALILTITTFALFKNLNRDRSGAIVMNLSLALLLLNISFIAATLMTPEYVLCIPAAVLLHYSVAASFTWMLIEALNMHSLLVTVFPSVETHFMVKRVGSGWGFPVLLITVALMWEKRVYINENIDLCIISPVSYKAVYYSTYFAPICVVLFINCIVFVLVSRVLCRRRLQGTTKQKESPPGKPSHKRFPVTLAQIRGAITVVALLGVTWIAGVFSVGTFRIFFQYVFCIATPLQGFIIFFVRVIQSAEARAAWHTFLTTGSRNRRHKHHHLSSLRTQSSSQNTHSVNTQSTGLANQKNVFASALRMARRLSLASESQQGPSSSPLSSSSFFGKTRKSFSDKWSIGSLQRFRRKSQKDNQNVEERSTNEASQKLNQMYGLYFQQEHQSPQGSNEECLDYKSECMQRNSSLKKQENTLDFYSTDVIPFERESEEEKLQDMSIHNLDKSPSMRPKMSPNFRIMANEKSFSLEGYTSNGKSCQSATEYKNYSQKDSTM